ncbi:phage portal protein [Chitiniphilus eburneus]|uniref:phage portal protein n=1 Tax=Chitiniphilus eburneus TaxID=2571148 RepID=UPI0035CF6325
MTKNKQPGRIKSALLGWLGVPIGLTDGAFWSGLGGASNNASQTVTVTTALQLSAVWACVRLISESIATLPLAVFRNESDGSKRPARDHDLYALLHDQPNADMTAVEFWQAFIASLLLWGNSYVEKHVSAGRVTSLEFLLPQYVTWKRESDGGYTWTYNDPRTGKTRTLTERTMWHTTAFTMDGICGLSPIRYGAQVFGSAQATEKAAAGIYKGGMRRTGVLSVDVVLKDDQRNQLRTQAQDALDNGRIFVAEKGAGFDAVTMNPADAELLATRSYGVEEACRWFLVPPFMVGHGEKTSTWGTGMEQQMIGFVTFVLRPWCVRIEQSIRKNLLQPAERMKFGAEFLLEGLLRGDSAARGAFYSVMVNNGIFTRDEVRRKESLQPLGGMAEVLTVQSAMVPLNDISKTQNDGQKALDALKAYLNEGGS